jgi:adenine-specific DNA-methyltransferase
MVLIPVRLPNGTELKITAGGQNVPVKKIVEDFCPRFTPGGVVIYVGDTGDKQRHIESGYFEQLGLKRHNELKDLFKGARAGLVFVTSFLTRRAMTKHLADIAWETEVWVAEAPSHIIHFNGERFLGPYG